MLEKVGEGLGDKGVSYRLLCLVCVRSLCGKAVGNEDETVLDIAEGNARFIFVCIYRWLSNICL